MNTQPQPFEPCIENMMMQVKEELKNAPAGSLNIKHSNGSVQYVNRADGPSLNCTYIAKSDRALICGLAQKNYDLKVMKELSHVLARARRLRLALPGSNSDVFDGIMLAELYGVLDNVYDRLSPERKELVRPIVPPTGRYVEDWLSLPYEGLKFTETDHTAYFTKDKVRVRSKSELYIGNFLVDSDLPYKYECPVNIGGITVHPDFTVLDARVRRVKYIEHCGMMDNPEYADSCIRKINLYAANGIIPGKQLILTYESFKFPLDTRTLGSLMAYHFPYANIPASL